MYPEDEQACLFLGLVAVREQSNPNNEHAWLVFGAGGCQEMVKTPKTSGHARFWSWWWPEKGRNPENEQSCSFLGVVAAGERSKPQRRAVMHQEICKVIIETN